MIRETIALTFAEVFRSSMKKDPPAVADDTVLLDSGLDSLGFAILVTRLEDTLGFDPFTLSEEAVYPQTFGEFIRFYERYAPR